MKRYSVMTVPNFAKANWELESNWKGHAVHSLMRFAGEWKEVSMERLQKFSKDNLVVFGFGRKFPTREIAHWIMAKLVKKGRNWQLQYWIGYSEEDFLEMANKELEAQADL